MRIVLTSPELVAQQKRTPADIDMEMRQLWGAHIRSQMRTITNLNPNLKGL